MLGNNNLMAIVVGKHIPRIKPHSKRGYMRSQLLRRGIKLPAGTFASKFRISNILAVTIGKTKMHALLRGTVQLVGGKIISEHIAPVIRKPKFAGIRVPVKGDSWLNKMPLQANRS